MPRKKLFLTNQLPYHVTGRVNNQLKFPLPITECWDIFSDFLAFCSNSMDLRVHAFVLMPNHFHLIASTPSIFLPVIMNRLMTDVSIAINADSKNINHVFGSRYHASLIENPYYFANAVKYVFRNPVRAGFCKNVEDYQWSSLGRSLGLANLYFPVLPFSPFESVFPEEIEKRLSWYNFDFEERRREILKKGFLKTVFNIPSKRTCSLAYSLRSSLC